MHRKRCIEQHKDRAETEKKPIIVKRFVEYFEQMKNDKDAAILKP